MFKKRFICTTCFRAGRIVSVVSTEVPTESEVHKAHKGFGLGLGSHGPDEMRIARRPIMRIELVLGLVEDVTS